MLTNDLFPASHEYSLLRFISVSPLPSPSKSPARTPIARQPCCTALYDFEPENPGELGFKVKKINK